MKRAIVVVLLLCLCASVHADDWYAVLFVAGQVKPGHRAELEAWFNAIVQRARDGGLSVAGVSCTVRPIYLRPIRTRKSPKRPQPKVLQDFEGFGAHLSITTKARAPAIYQVHNEMLNIPGNVQFKGRVLLRFQTRPPHAAKRK